MFLKVQRTVRQYVWCVRVSFFPYFLFWISFVKFQGNEWFLVVRGVIFGNVIKRSLHRFNFHFSKFRKTWVVSVICLFEKKLPKKFKFLEEIFGEKLPRPFLRRLHTFIAPTHPLGVPKFGTFPTSEDPSQGIIFNLINHMGYILG